MVESALVQHPQGVFSEKGIALDQEMFQAAPLGHRWPTGGLVAAGELRGRRLFRFRTPALHVKAAALMAELHVSIQVGQLKELVGHPRAQVRLGVDAEEEHAGLVVHPHVGTQVNLREVACPWYRRQVAQMQMDHMHGELRQPRVAIIGIDFHFIWDQRADGLGWQEPRDKEHVLPVLGHDPR